MQLLRVALRCVYQTLHFTKIHSNAITEARMIPVLQMIIEKEGVHEKLKLLALQTLRELAINGYHTILLDMTLINRLLRFLQPSSLGSIVSLESEEAPSCLHRAALEVLEALIAASSYNSQNLI
jgi:hypothetical protein